MPKHLTNAAYVCIEIIAVFNNMQTLKFKPQLTVYVFRCCQSSKRTSCETEAHFSRVKRSRLLVVIGRFWSILFVFVFQGLLAVAIIIIDGSEKPNCQLGFELQGSHVIENRNNSKWWCCCGDYLAGTRILWIKMLQKSR